MTTCYSFAIREARGFLTPSARRLVAGLLLLFACKLRCMSKWKHWGTQGFPHAKRVRYHYTMCPDVGSSATQMSHVVILICLRQRWLHALDSACCWLAAAPMVELVRWPRWLRLACVHGRFLALGPAARKKRPSRLRCWEKRGDPSAGETHHPICIVFILKDRRAQRAALAA